MDVFVGTWQVNVSRSPGLVDFMLATGTPKEYCTEANVANSKVIVKKDGSRYSYQTEIPGLPSKINYYTPGQPFEIDTPYGLKFKCTISQEGSKFVEILTAGDGTEIRTVREVNGSEMKAVTTCKGQTVTTYLTKI